MARPLRVALLGAGAMGYAHAAAYKVIAGVEIAGIFSRDLGRAQSAADAFATMAVSDAAALIEDASVDAVDVCVPSYAHAGFVIAALNRGKHVFCETPFALSMTEAQQMIAARPVSATLQVGLLMRAIPAYQHVKERSASGALGKLLSVTAHRLGSYLRPGAADHKPHYGEPSVELMTFDFDFANWLFGKPRSLTAAAARTQGDAPGEISAILQYAGGRQATVIASGILPASFTFTAGFRAVFERGAYEHEVTFDRIPPTQSFRYFPEAGKPEAVQLTGVNPYEWELRHFVDCINGEGDRELLAPERAVEALELSLATQASLRKGRTITLS